MSRMGKRPVEIPSGVEARIKDNIFSAKGPKGELHVELVSAVNVDIVDGQVAVNPASSSRTSLSMWGTSRSLILNVIKGVSQGFVTKLELNGVGYRAEVKGDILKLALGFSHDVLLNIPNGVTVTCTRGTQLSLEGADWRVITSFASVVRSYRPPEPYKGKGIKYENEIIFRKEGKKK